METDPKARLREIKERLAELKREREALMAERDRLRVALGRDPRQSETAKSD